MSLLSLEGVTHLFCDCDGVLTDGYVTIDENGIESVRYHKYDALGIRAFQKVGVAVVFLSAEARMYHEHRAGKLYVSFYRVHDKDKFVRGSFGSPGYIGVSDTKSDVEFLRRAKYGFYPANSQLSESEEASEFLECGIAGKGVLYELAKRFGLL